MAAITQQIGWLKQQKCIVLPKLRCWQPLLTAASKKSVPSVSLLAFGGVLTITWPSLASAAPP